MRSGHPIPGDEAVIDPDEYPAGLTAEVIGPRIKHAREYFPHAPGEEPRRRYNWTQQRVADALGVSVSMITGWEQRRHRPQRAKELDEFGHLVGWPWEFLTGADDWVIGQDGDGQ